MDSHVGGCVGDGVVVPEATAATGVGVNLPVPWPPDEDVGMLFTSAAPVKSPDPGRRGLDRRVQELSERNTPLGWRITLSEVQRVVCLMVVGRPGAPGNIIHYREVLDKPEAAAIHLVDRSASVGLGTDNEVVVGRCFGN